MKVKELIKLLGSFDPEMTVSATDEKCCSCAHEIIESAEIVVWGSNSEHETLYLSQGVNKP